jgi:hypothetical protein
MPADVIERVHLIALQQKADTGLTFADRNNSEIDIEDLEIYDELSQQSEDDSDTEHWFKDKDNSNGNDEDEAHWWYYDT